MHSSMMLLALGAPLAAYAQGEGAGAPPPPPELLTMTMSGVLPVLPTNTPFAGVETEEGAIIYDGPVNPGFTGLGGTATVQAGLPAATYEAVLPSTNFDNLTGSTVTGSIVGSSTSGGSGVTFTVNFTGFPSEAEYGPFVYHIHNLAVPADGNCSATLGHLDPTNRGEYYPCDVTAPNTCQVGDLAGKHGNITMGTFFAQFTDPYLSTDPSSPSFFGDKSIVIHSENTTRLTCANFAQVSSTNSSMPNATMPSTPSSTVMPYTGAASKLSGASIIGAVVGIAAIFLL